MIQRSLIAILLSLTGLAMLLKINHNIAHVYEVSGEKTRAVFSLVELGFLYKYYAGIFGLIAIVLSILALRNKEKKQWVRTAMLISIVAFVATFVKLWRVMV
jgi:hypothetical protein